MKSRVSNGVTNVVNNMAVVSWRTFAESQLNQASCLLVCTGFVVSRFASFITLALGTRGGLQLSRYDVLYKCI